MTPPRLPGAGQTRTALELDDEDYRRMRALNGSAVPAVNDLDEASLRRLCVQAAAVPVERRDRALVGFMVLLDEHADYASPNFRWFRARYDAFLYVDRVVVEGRQRGLGVGRALYAVAAALARSRAVPLTCEVNLQPPNPESLRFHARLGFQPLAEQWTEGGGKRVQLMALPAEAGMLRRDPGARV